LTAREALADAERRLTAAGVDTSRVDAELLVAHVLGTTRSGVHAELDRDVDGSLEPLLVRREAREPLAYVLGEWGFRRLVLKTDARALVPRPETETVVDRVLALLAGVESPRVLDIGVGSGAIALAVKDERPDARVTGVDVSADALALAGENAARLALDVELREGGIDAAAEAGSSSFQSAVRPLARRAPAGAALRAGGRAGRQRLPRGDRASGEDTVRRVRDRRRSGGRGGCDSRRGGVLGRR
jgi:Methylase of polypeptide chain release factors